MPKTSRHFPPPTKSILDRIRGYLQKLQPLDVAAMLAGVPRTVLLSWVEDGRKGLSEYTPFVDMVDEEHAKLSELVLKDIYSMAFEDRNFNALTFLYKTRLQHSENRLRKKLDAIEDRIEAESAASTGNVLTEEELAEIERRASEEELDQRH